MTQLKNVERFHLMKNQIPNIILSRTDQHETIHGQQAVNAQISPHLHKQTTDYDIFTKTPKKDARETERALDKRFGFNAFKVEEGKHAGTWKVKSTVNGETYADYTKPEKKIQKTNKFGKNYASLDYFKKHIRKTLKDPEAKFRHPKDKDTLNRIKIHEQNFSLPKLNLGKMFKKPKRRMKL